MRTIIRLATLLVGLMGGWAGCCHAAEGAVAEEKVLYVYNWSDYVAPDTLARSEAETGIKVVYDVFDDNGVLEAKLLSGKTGYDVVVPSLNFLARQIQAGVFMPLEKARLPNHRQLDERLMSKLEYADPGQRYAVPYLWGTTGLGINVDAVRKALGPDAPLDSWQLLFNPKYLSKLKACGVAVLDAPDEVIPAALHYLGEDPNSLDVELMSSKVRDLLLQMRPYVRYFHSSKYINDLANGDICLAMGWSGDILQAAQRADEAHNGVNISYVIPVEGAGLWFDMMAIPKDATHPENAHRFLDFLMRPDVIADISNYVAYPNAIPASSEVLDPEIRDDVSVYPLPEVMEKLFIFEVMPPKVDRAQNRLWIEVKSRR
jgi:putrescine transport system substrate-binding protein